MQFCIPPGYPFYTPSYATALNPVWMIFAFLKTYFFFCTGSTCERLETL